MSATKYAHPTPTDTCTLGTSWVHLFQCSWTEKRGGRVCFLTFAGFSPNPFSGVLFGTLNGRKCPMWGYKRITPANGGHRGIQLKKIHVGLKKHTTLVQAAIENEGMRTEWWLRRAIRVCVCHQAVTAGLRQKQKRHYVPDHSGVHLLENEI